MFTGFVADIGRVLKKGSKIRIPNLGVLQVRIRPARPARRGVTRPRARSFKSKPVEPQRRFHSESQRV